MRRMKLTQGVSHDDLVADTWAARWLRRSVVDRKVGHDTYDKRSWQRERDEAFAAYDLLNGGVQHGE